MVAPPQRDPLHFPCGVIMKRLAAVNVVNPKVANPNFENILSPHWVPLNHPFSWDFPL